MELLLAIPQEPRSPILEQEIATWEVLNFGQQKGVIIALKSNYQYTT